MQYFYWESQQFLSQKDITGPCSIFTESHKQFLSQKDITGPCSIFTESHNSFFLRKILQGLAVFLLRVTTVSFSERYYRALQYFYWESQQFLSQKDITGPCSIFTETHNSFFLRKILQGLAVFLLRVTTVSFSERYYRALQYFYWESQQFLSQKDITGPCSIFTESHNSFFLRKILQDLAVFLLRVTTVSFSERYYRALQYFYWESQQFLSQKDITGPCSIFTESHNSFFLRKILQDLAVFLLRVTTVSFSERYYRALQYFYWESQQFLSQKDITGPCSIFTESHNSFFLRKILQGLAVFLLRVTTVSFSERYYRALQYFYWESQQFLSQKDITGPCSIFTESHNSFFLRKILQGLAVFLLRVTTVSFSERYYRALQYFYWESQQFLSQKDITGPCSIFTESHNSFFLRKILQGLAVFLLRVTTVSFSERYYRALQYRKLIKHNISLFYPFLIFKATIRSMAAA